MAVTAGVADGSLGLFGITMTGCPPCRKRRPSNKPHRSLALHQVTGPGNPLDRICAVSILRRTFWGPAAPRSCGLLRNGRCL